MRRRTRQPYRSTVTKEAQRRSVTETTEFRASAEQSQRDRIELQEKLDAIDTELDEHDLIVQITKGYLHVQLNSAVVTVLGTSGLEVADVAFETTIRPIGDGVTIPTPYSATVTNQFGSANTLYFSNNRVAQTFTVRATTFAGAPIDMRVGVLEFSVMVNGTAT